MNMRSWSICFLLVLLSTGCATPAGKFSVEPRLGITILPKSELTSGQTIEIRIIKLAEGEHFRLYKCGVPCNTAKHVLTWNKCCFPDVQFKPYEIRENGKHYFWMQRILEDGSSGPVLVDTIIYNDSWTIVTFESGSKVRMRLQDS
jgi:hypothetical protein